MTTPTPMMEAPMALLLFYAILVLGIALNSFFSAADDWHHEHWFLGFLNFCAGAVCLGVSCVLVTASGILT